MLKLSKKIKILKDRRNAFIKTNKRHLNDKKEEILEAYHDAIDKNIKLFKSMYIHDKKSYKKRKKCIKLIEKYLGIEENNLLKI